MNLFSPSRRAVILITVQLNVSIAENGRDLDKDEVPHEDRTGKSHDSPIFVISRTLQKPSVPLHRH